MIAPARILLTPSLAGYGKPRLTEQDGVKVHGAAYEVMLLTHRARTSES